jgi:hypothetical protein
LEKKSKVRIEEIYLNEKFLFFFCIIVRLEYRYMQLIENNNPDDDTPVDNVCAQLSDEEDSGEEVQFKTQSKAKKIMNAVRKVIGKVEIRKEFY